MSLSGNGEDVRFAHAEAARLSASLRSAARLLDAQRAPRASWERAASADFRGRYAEVFARGARTAAADGAEIADALRDAADKLDELDRLAREEQARREQARAWQRKHDARGLLDKAHDAVFGDDSPPPPAHPGPRVLVKTPPVAARGEQS